MSRKKRHEEHVNHERWLVSYADFITLLFAFFVVLYSSSQVDKRKVGRLSLAIQVAFQQMGVFETSNTKMPLSTTEPMPFQDAQMIENVVRTEDLRRIVQPAGGVLSNAILSGEMLGIQKEIESALAPEIRSHVVDLKEEREGLVISLREIGFFESGSATLRNSSRDSIDRLAAVLGTRSEMLRIEGHTDNVPIHNAQFQSNWELSTARATELTKLFITHYDFSPDRLAAAGYAQYHPVDSNSTAEGRAHNRRVDIVVLRPIPLLTLPAPVVPSGAASQSQPVPPASPNSAPPPGPASSSTPVDIAPHLEPHFGVNVRPVGTPAITPKSSSASAPQPNAEQHKSNVPPEEKHADKPNE